MADFAAMLSPGGAFDRFVIDATGLKGHYDIRLEPGRDGALSQPDDLVMLSSQMAAFREPRSLRVEARKAPVEVLVIDRVESAPCEN